MYLYTSVPLLRKQREVTGVVHIGVGFLRCSLGGGHCEGLEHGTDEGKIPTLFLYIPFILHLSVYPVGVRGTLTGRLGMIHAGQLIERTLHEQGRTVTWFAGQLCCTRPNIYKIFKKENIDIHLLCAFRAYSIIISSYLSDNIRIGIFFMCIQIRYISVSYPEL